MNIQNNHIVDIRRPSEWMESGIIEGSKLITFVNLNGNINPMFLPLIEQNFKKNDEIVLMCRTAHRSKIAMKFLQEKGYSNVKEIKGGAYYFEKMGAKFVPYSGE